LNINKGKEMLEKEAKRQGYKLTNILKEDWLKNVSNKLSLNSSNDLYAGLGYGSITLSQVMPRLKELYNDYYQIEDDKIVSEPRIKEQPTPQRGRSVTQG